MRPYLSLLSALSGLLFAAPGARADEINIAVASNFLKTAEAIVAQFEADTGHEVTLAHGSTGQIFAQIMQGAPFDIFLAADAVRPAKLRDADKATEIRTYALGRLVLVSKEKVSLETAVELFAGDTVALADPTVAPYGLAATSAMERMGLDTATFKPVLVANVGQVATVFQTGNADHAFVARALLGQGLEAPFVLDLDGMHPEIRQDAALLARSADKPAVRAFWDILFSDNARTITLEAGYGLPE